jgi:manganese transport protein
MNTTATFSDKRKTILTTGTGKWRKLLAFIGPAYLVSVGYMDPGNWATDIAAGSQFGYALLWVILLANITAILVQSLSARLGLVTGKDMAQFSRSYYSPGINFSLWILAETAIAATDLAEVLGVAIGLKLLFNLDMLIGVSLALFDTFIVMFLVRKGMRTLEAFIIALISIIGISFVIELFFSKPSLSGVLTGFIPSFPGTAALYLATGIIGATVMPHNLYLHSSIVQTRKFKTTHEGISQAIKYNFIDTALALNLALFVNAAILILAASAFFRTGHFEVQDITDAYKMLAPILGTSLAPILFAVALIISGQSSTLTGTITGQIIMEGYLNLRISPVIRRLITRLLAVVPAFLVIWLAGESKAGSLLILSQVILSFQLGFALIPLIHWVSSARVMGNFKIRAFTQLVSWIAVAIIIALNTKLLYDVVSDFVSSGSHPFIAYGIILPLLFAGILLLIYVLVEPFISHELQRRFKPTHAAFGFEIQIERPKPFRKIAVPVDFSPTDQQALNYAISQGGKEAEYILIHVVESAGARMLRSDITDLESSDDQGFIARYAEVLQSKGYKSNTIIGYGMAGTVIPEVIEQVSADLLVMSSHKKGTAHRIFKGTTIANVQKRIAIPMIILK